MVPAVLEPARLSLGHAATEGLGRTGRAVDPVGQGIARVVELEVVGVRSGRDDMRAVRTEGPPGQLAVQRPPARAVQRNGRARAATERGWQRPRRDTLGGS